MIPIVKFQHESDKLLEFYKIIAIDFFWLYFETNL